MTFIGRRIQKIVDAEVSARMECCKNELEQLQKLTQDNQKHLETLEFLLKMYKGKFKKEHQEREQELLEHKKSLELQKYHCYIISRITNSSGLDLPENFDITEYEQAKDLYNRLRNGDLKNY